MESKEQITIHGESYERDYIEGNIAECRGRSWQRQRWTAEATPHKGSTEVSPHDHCQICWWTLSDSADPAQNTGYTDGRGWICTECYDRFIAGATRHI